MRYKAATILAIATVLCIASTSAAQVTAKFCMGWQTNLADTQLGEDRLTPTPNTNSDEQAYYTWASVSYQDSGNWYTQWTGSLDADGCTPYVTIHNLKNYKFRRRSILIRSNREMWLQQSGTTSWGDYYGYDDCDLYLALMPGTYTLGGNCPSTPLSDHFRMMPVYSEAMQYANTIEMPTDMETSVSTNNTLCGGSSKYIGPSGTRHRVCIAPGHVNDKFVQIHEFGHAVARANNGPRRGDYYADREEDGSAGDWFDTDTDDMCNCDVTV